MEERLKELEEKLKEHEDRIEELENWRERILGACDTYEVKN
jgi:hypothetical protein